jgi:cell division protein FtsW
MLENNFIIIAFWKWWRTLDRQLLLAVLILISASLLLVTTASSSVANRIGLPEDFFSKRHIFYVLISFFLVVLFSNLSVQRIKQIGISLFLLNFIFLILVKFVGYEIKGAKRWINIVGFSLQPSEFIKPFFAIIVAYIFSIYHNRNYSFIISATIYLFVAILLILQPDLGMLITLTGIWGIQLFIAGLPLIWIFGAVIFIAFGLYFAYLFLPHVTSRIDSFLDPNAHENYQVSQSIKAFETGGYFGKGPGEGIIKHNIPDSHADFIFAIAGEEFGSVMCVFISLVFAFIVIRGIILLIKKSDEFVVLASSGIISQLALQSIINMGVSLNLLPTKGMTLPFISYGGSSSIAVGISVGILLSLSKDQISETSYKVDIEENG